MKFSDIRFKDWLFATLLVAFVALAPVLLIALIHKLPSSYSPYVAGFLLTVIFYSARVVVRTLVSESNWRFRK